MLSVCVYPSQVVLDLSDSQVQDLLFIRRLNLTKRCVLSAERTALMRRMAASEAEALDNRSDHLQTVSLLAAQLQQNTAEDRQVYYKLAKALYRGVCTQICLHTFNCKHAHAPRPTFTVLRKLQWH